VEIKDYLKVLGKRAWLLIMIPAVAGVVAGLIAVQQPQAFRTTATLQLPHDVTSSPAEVAQLVASGLANREIAARLYLSVRTVEVHVDRILTKLGFHTRTQLTAWAHEQGLMTGNTGNT